MAGIEYVKKRDGRIVAFDKTRIVNAVFKAAQAVGGSDRTAAERLASVVTDQLCAMGQIPTVEQIQDAVEKVLIEEGHAKTAKAYILYRKQHEDIRNVFSLLSSTEMVENYLDRSDWRVKENANMSYSLQGLNFHISSAVISNYWVNKIYPPEIADAHASGDFHIHDLGILGAYCVGWDLKDLLLNGFGHVHGKIASKPAKHFRTALGQVVNFFYTLQGEAAGAQAFSSFDTFLAPFIRYDGLDYAQVKQALQEFVFNINVPTRVGFQSLAYEELVVIRQNGRVKITPIGQYVDAQFKKNASRICMNTDGYSNLSNESFAVPSFEDAEVIGFNSEGKSKWLKLKASIRHRVKNAKFLKIRTLKGETRVSPAHSLFHIENGVFKPVAGNRLKTARPNERVKQDNHIIALQDATHLFRQDASLDLVEVVKQMPKALHKNVYVDLSAESFAKFEKNVEHAYSSKRQLMMDYGRKDRTNWNEWKIHLSIPFDVWCDFGDENDKQIKLRLIHYPDVSVERQMSGETLEKFLCLAAWYITEGKSDQSSISIAQAPTFFVEEIKQCITGLGQKCEVSESRGWSPKTGLQTETIVTNLLVHGTYSYFIKHTCGITASEKIIPSYMYELDAGYRRLFLETLVKGDGHVTADGKIGFTTKSRKLLSGLSLFLASLNLDFSVNRKDKRTDCYTLYYFPKGKSKKKILNDFVAVPVYEIEEIDYDHEWEYDLSVDEKTENFAGGPGLLIYHNTPFTNVTMDLNVPAMMKGEPVIAGGEFKNEVYGDFEPEMKMFNEAFAEVMMEGDANGRVFTFPIPTYNITKDFNWDAPVTQKIFEMTAKYGVPYFSNFINSDMSPEDARSMCIAADESILYRKDGTIHKSTIKEFVETNTMEFDSEGWANPALAVEVPSLNPESMKIEWKKVKRFLKVKKTNAVTIKMRDGKEFKASENHLVSVLTPDGLKEKLARDVKIGDYALSLKDGSGLLNQKYQKLQEGVLDENTAFLMGFFTADGNFLWDNRNGRKLSGVQFSIGSKDTELIERIKKQIQTVWNVGAKFKKDPRYNTAYLYVYRRKIAEKIRESGFKKHGKLPDVLLNSPKTVIEAFLDGFYQGDGYDKRNEIHINDLELAQDLTRLYGMIGVPTIFQRKANSQRIYLQTRHNDINAAGLTNTPCLYEYIPGFMAKSTYVVPGLIKNRMVGAATLQKYHAHTEQSLKIMGSDIYPVRVTGIDVHQSEDMQEFYDVELEENHLFLHSLGTITHNCCRLRLDNRELRKRGGGLFGANPLTGSIGVVTLNLPRIGHLAKNTQEYFERLDALMDLAQKSLEIKREVLESFTEKGLYPYSKYYLRDIRQVFGTYWKNHFATIGLIGLNESVQNLLGVDIGHADGKKFAVRVLQHMRERLSQYQQQTGNIYNLEATPGEGTSYRLAKLDTAKFPEIKVANQNAFRERHAAPYYTNSSHLPVGHTPDIFEALEHQDELQTQYTGGTVLHGFVGERISDWRTARELVHKIADNFHLPYFTLTPTFSVCPKHGYLTGEHQFCPRCDEDIGYVALTEPQPISLKSTKEHATHAVKA